MPKLEDLSKNCQWIGYRFAPLIGQRLIRYSAAEMYFEKEDIWERWDDLPLRLYFEPASVLSVSWRGIDELGVTQDEALPYWYHGKPVTRWVSDNVPELENCIGHSLTDVRLGRGEASIEGKEIAVWTRLLLGFEDGWFEIFNALDENSYDYHSELPEGEFQSCV